MKNCTEKTYLVQEVEMKSMEGPAVTSTGYRKKITDSYGIWCVGVHGHCDGCTGYGRTN